MGESTIFGVSVRALLALITVVSGLAFLYVVGLLTTSRDILNIVVTAVISFITLALGFYLGQKSAEPSAPPEDQ